MLHKAVMPGYEEDLSRVLVTIMDLTPLNQARREREQLSKQLQQSQKMEAIGTLAGGIAHDFNNILAVIMGYSELILGAPSDVQANMRNVAQILKASGRARKLVRQILTFSRKVQSDLQALDFNAEIVNAVSILKCTLPKMIQIETQLAPNLSPINADATQIEQVIINLGSNAADAMPSGGRIGIQTSQTNISDQDFLSRMELKAGKHLMLKFSDNGCGMDQETLQQIFDPFFTTKEIGKGTGLGLSTTFGIIKSHSGHIACESTPGVGTCFTIYLPAIETE
jgi:two-component system cell cycle sensor histidine kinase/response regulator CckA